MFASTINVLKEQMGALKGKILGELDEIIMIQIQLFKILIQFLKKLLLIKWYFLAQSYPMKKFAFVVQVMIAKNGKDIQQDAFMTLILE